MGSECRFSIATLASAVLLGLGAAAAPANAQTPANGSVAAATEPAARDAGVPVPAEYRIGPEDVLGINFWRDADMTGDVTVRPDGRITLPLLGDIVATGLSPEQLKVVVHEAASKLIADPAVTIIVRQINSRKVFITGQVATPDAYPLAGPRTVMQLIALAGGLTEYADKKNIRVMRMENGQTRSLKFNYNDVTKGKNLQQNVLLQPGDTVVVP